jgi:hypothetical protein
MRRAAQTTLPRTCKDCDAPVDDDLLPFGECWYWGQMTEQFRREGKSEEDIARWRNCGADPPCSCNNYDQWSERRERRSLLVAIIAIIVIMVFLGMIAL